mmetsp:Transcript_21557/g.31344  ORF Transcript_21557/g.31344 Transcript_21557/m.31344 type:complete len:469 (-) Transcript_21557:31-1437(-)
MSDSKASKIHIFKFVLTGGPCSGKTSAFSVITNYLKEHDYRVYMVPEAATLLFSNGVSFSDMDVPERKYAMQQSVMKMQIQLENAFENVARSTGQNCILLCDRGVMCGSAYIDRDLFVDILAEQDMDVVSARDSRYDCVMHLVTAADGARKYYTLENNVARSESAEFAIEVDVAVQHAWSGHPHHFIFDNSHPSFDHKLDALVSRIARELGLPHPRHGAEYLPPTVTYSLPDEGFPSECMFPPDTKAFLYTITYLLTSSENTTDGTKDSADVDSSGVDEVVDSARHLMLHRKVVARYVTQRIPVPLQRTVPPPPPTEVHPLAPHPEKDFRDDNTVPSASYTLTVMRELENDDTGHYKSHMTVDKTAYDELVSSQRDPRARQVHQKRYTFINRRQPITVVRCTDDWVVAAANAADPSPATERLECAAWIEICTEGSPPLEIPPFLHIGAPLSANNLDYDLSQLAKVIEV